MQFMTYAELQPGDAFIIPVGIPDPSTKHYLYRKREDGNADLYHCTGVFANTLMWDASGKTVMWDPDDFVVCLALSTPV